MKKILHIISSPRGKNSLSIKLGNAIVDKLMIAHPGSQVTTHDLTNHPFPHLEEVHLQSFYTPVESRTPALTAAAKHSDDSIKEIFDADIIVIGAPLYNFGIHSTLKAWIDQVVRAGITFSYDESGPKGLIKGKKVFLAISSGGIYSEGPMKQFDFVEPYLRDILGFIGMKDITAFRIEGSALPGMQDEAIDKGINSIVLD